MTMDTATAQDPFAATATDAGADMFDDPSTDFVTVDDLDGRLVCVYPKEVRREDSRTNAGKQYDKIVADVIVLSGPVTDKVTEVPMFLPDMHFSAGAVVGALRGGVGTGRPRLGRIDSQPSRHNRQVKAYGMKPATDAEKTQAAPIVRQVLAANQFQN